MMMMMVMMTMISIIMIIATTRSILKQILPSLAQIKCAASH